MKPLFWVAFGALWLVVIVQGLAFLEVLRQIGSIRERIPSAAPLVMGEGVTLGAELPPLQARALESGRPVMWAEYLGQDLNLVLFLHPRCPNCYALAQDFTAYAHRTADRVKAVVVLNTSGDEAVKFATSTGLDRSMVAFDERSATSDGLGIRFTPAALLVQGRRLGQAAVVNNLSQVDAMVERGVLEASELAMALSQRPATPAQLDEQRE